MYYICNLIRLIRLRLNSFDMKGVIGWKRRAMGVGWHWCPRWGAQVYVPGFIKHLAESQNGLGMGTSISPILQLGTLRPRTVG